MAVIVKKEILGSHAFDVRQSVKGRVGSAKDGARDFDVTIGGNETRIVGGTYDLNVTKNLTQISLADILVNAKNNMSLKTTTGIVAVGAGSNVLLRYSVISRNENQIWWCI